MHYSIICFVLSIDSINDLRYSRFGLSPRIKISKIFSPVLNQKQTIFSIFSLNHLSGTIGKEKQMKTKSMKTVAKAMKSKKKRGINLAESVWVMSEYSHSPAHIRTFCQFRGSFNAI